MSQFVAIVRAEFLFNAKRIAPYLMALIFAANAILWWGWGPAVRLGWATNSDFYIARNLQGFSFILGLPIFNAVIMGDPVIRDFRFGINSLIFSKPCTRTTYLLGKFCGNFLVLICCQSVFALMSFALQAFTRSGMIVQPVKVLPYFKHFLFFVVVSHLLLATVYFAIGTLTRKIALVYGAAVSFYPLYIAYQSLLLKGLPPFWRSLLDPMLLNSGGFAFGFGKSAEFYNNAVVHYSALMLTNRFLVILLGAAGLVLTCKLFRNSERTHRSHQVLLNLSTPQGRVDFGGDIALPLIESSKQIELPSVARVFDGWKVKLKQTIAMVGYECQLLLAERSLIVLMPLAAFLATLELIFWRVAPVASSLSAAYAGRSANTLLLFVLGMSIFYTSESMQREREVNVQPVLWSMPVTNSMLLLSKFMSTVVLAGVLIAIVFVFSITLQFFKGDSPIELSYYLLAHWTILLPSGIFIVSLTVMLNSVLRDKHVVYVVAFALCAGMYYLYMNDLNHWSFNPTLLGLWSEANLLSRASWLLTVRIYCFALTLLFLAVSYLTFARPESSRS